MSPPYIPLPHSRPIFGLSRFEPGFLRLGVWPLFPVGLRQEWILHLRLLLVRVRPQAEDGEVVHDGRRVLGANAARAMGTLSAILL